MTEGTDDFSAGPPPPPAAASPTSSTVDTGRVPEEKPKEKQEEAEEEEAAGQSGEEAAEGDAEAGADDGEHMGAVGIMALAGSCCVCVEMEQIRNCVHSEKICILPILACLLSLALCTAGLKWVFVDKIFEYEPPTHLDPKPIGQDPFIISADPTLGLTVSVPLSSLSPTSLTSAPLTSTSLSPSITVERHALTPGHPDVFLEDKSTRGPKVPPDPSVTLKYNAERPSTTKQTPHPLTTQETNDIIPTVSATSTTTKAKTSSHVTRCSNSQRNYCVNGGECFTLEIMPGSTKFLCRCPNEFTGDRCQNYVMASFYKAEELYQKRILTISGICIALLVVGIMCVVAYCKTKKQRKKLQDRLRQSLRTKKKKQKNTKTGPKQASSARGQHITNMPLQDLQPQSNGTSAQHAADKDTETTFTSKNAFPAHEHTTFTHVSSQRFIPSLTSPGSRTSLTTPGSPPSEMSVPISSLAVSVPSVALSPSGEEERPLLLLNNRRTRDEQKRSSAHYNHGHVAHSLPASPLLPDKKGDCQVIGEHEDTAGSQVFSPDNLPETNMKRAEVTHSMESSCDSMPTDDIHGEQTPFIATGSQSARLLEVSDVSRTNTAAPLNDRRDESSCPTNKPDPESV
uniref:Neuregulin 1 n=1 Tax=Labrus bergylta TaxID=56723 RepID=A0A3Q3EUB3_9LABR|nr:pro-neuregulin-1, membrane-bound isoform-like isoform X1 [Labrus bergylta]XP_020514910.1 pro-neuregulin-1, membrane-bound isoform-like isoform X1 [Labrus bergylta]